MLKLNSVSHFVADRYLFQNLNLSLAKKKYGLVGSNGVGKSTLAKIAAGLLQPTEGSVYRQGEIVYLSLRKFEGSLVIASHDAKFVERLQINKQVTLRRQRR